ncbi:MAG: HAD family phosphatase [Bacteroidetes bacterium]|nr:HAD family phosphatase [Bacteroidota bacterium]
MKKAVIFDMDGVLIDSEPEYMEMNRSLFSGLGIDFENSDFDQYVGMSSFKMWSGIKEKYKLVNDVEELIETERRKMFEILSSDKISGPVKGIPELLTELRFNDIVLNVASSSAKRNIELILNKLNLTKFFTVIVSGEEVKYGKPAPDIFLLVSDKTGIPPEKCLVIEDSSNGITAAKSAGMKCIGFKNSGTNLQDLSGADFTIMDFSINNISIITEYIKNI